MIVDIDKKYCFNFLFKIVFCFSIYKMIDSEYSIVQNKAQLMCDKAWYSKFKKHKALKKR